MATPQSVLSSHSRDTAATWPARRNVKHGTFLHVHTTPDVCYISDTLRMTGSAVEGVEPGCVLDIQASRVMAPLRRGRGRPTSSPMTHGAVSLGAWSILRSRVRLAQHGCLIGLRYASRRILTPVHHFG